MHTPTPWAIGAVIAGEPDAIHGTRVIHTMKPDQEPDGEMTDICYVHPSGVEGDGLAEERDANATFIVLACNNFEQMRAILNDCVQTLDSAEEAGFRFPVLARARKALAALEAK